MAAQAHDLGHDQEAEDQEAEVDVGREAEDQEDEVDVGQRLGQVVDDGAVDDVDVGLLLHQGEAVTIPNAADFHVLHAVAI